MKHVTIDVSTEESSVVEEGISISALLEERRKDERKAAALARARRKHGQALSSPKHALAKLRLDRGLSQTMLAEAMGVSQPYVAKIERGEDDLRASTIAKLASALQISPTEIFEALCQMNDTKEVIDA